MPKVGLKNGWTCVAFGDVVKLCRERSSDPSGDGFDRYVGLDHIEPGDLKIRRWGNTREGTTFTNVFRPGHVLFGKRRAYQRKVAVPNFDGVCSGDVYVFEPKNERLLAEFLPFICQTEGFFQHAVGTSAGSLSPRTNWNSLAAYMFALPPLQEQQRIVKALSAAEAVSASMQTTIGSARQLTNAIADRLILGHLHDLPTALKVGLNTQEWKEVTLGEVCKLGGGHGFRPNEWTKRGIPIIRIQNVRGSKDFNYFGGDPDPAWLVEPGELLFAWAGVPGVSFGPAIWEGPLGVLNQHIFRVTPLAGIRLSWLYEVLRHLTPRIESRAHGFKHSLLHIRRSEFTTLRVMLPPENQQALICEMIQTLRKTESSIERRCDQVKQIKQDLLVLTMK
jgi:type I restriction enzyme S subunit